MGKSSHIKYFEYRELPTKGFVIAPIYESFGYHYIEGSWAVLPARIFGVDYVEWLHYCEVNGARLIGINWDYVLGVWENPNQQFLDELNRRTNALASIIDLKGLSY